MDVIIVLGITTLAALTPFFIVQFADYHGRKSQPVPVPVIHKGKVEYQCSKCNEILKREISE